MTQTYKHRVIDYTNTQTDQIEGFGIQLKINDKWVNICEGKKFIFSKNRKEANQIAKDKAKLLYEMSTLKVIYDTEPSN